MHANILAKSCILHNNCPFSRATVSLDFLCNGKLGEGAPWFGLKLIWGKRNERTWETKEKYCRPTSYPNHCDDVLFWPQKVNEMRLLSSRLEDGGNWSIWLSLFYLEMLSVKRPFLRRKKYIWCVRLALSLKATNPQLCTCKFFCQFSYWSPMMFQTWGCNFFWQGKVFTQRYKVDIPLMRVLFKK
jgi:hypothetical protein